MAVETRDMPFHGKRIFLRVMNPLAHLHRMEAELLEFHLHIPFSYGSIVAYVAVFLFILGSQEPLGMSRSMDFMTV